MFEGRHRQLHLGGAASAARTWDRFGTAFGTNKSFIFNRLARFGGNLAKKKNVATNARRVDRGKATNARIEGAEKGNGSADIEE